MKEVVRKGLRDLSVGRVVMEEIPYTREDPVTAQVKVRA